MRIQSAYIEITDQCNLNCRICYNRSDMGQEAHPMRLQDYENHVRRLSEEFGCHRFILSGGEPLLHPQFALMLDYVLADPANRVAVVTNGTIPCDHISERHLRSEALSFQVSLDGSSEIVNARSRGAGQFEKTLYFLRYLTTKGHSPDVQMVVTKVNLEDIPSFIRLIHAEGCTPIFLFVNRIGNAADAWDALGLLPKEIMQAIRSIETCNAQMGTHVEIPRCSWGCGLSSKEEPHRVLIKPDGYVQPCLLLYDARYSIGNLHTDTSEQMEAKAHAWADRAVARQTTAYGCSRCFLQSRCGRGCPALADYAHSDFMACDEMCTLRRLEFAHFEMAGIKHT